MLDFAARVDIGVRKKNDDRLLVAGQILDMESCSGQTDTPAVIAVCDGCGGYEGGGLAAQTVLEILSAEDARKLTDQVYLAQTLEKCKAAVYAKKEDNPKFADMCTTVAGCVLTDECTVIFHSGDSRVYRYDDWGLVRITRDHSVVQGMIDDAVITEKEARSHPDRNLITRCIGVNGLPPEIYISGNTIKPGDVYLFCSDGLWESVTDDAITAVLESGIAVSEMVETLVEMALCNGADDNISLCICIGTEDEDRGSVDNEVNEVSEVKDTTEE